MRDDAMGLIEASAKKMVALVAFARVAFGAATSSERFQGAELGELVSGLTEGGRASLTWAVEDMTYSKAQSRALVNLGYLTMAALPSGGVATIETRTDGTGLVIEGRAEGARARLKGQWIQPYWLWLTAHDAGGSLDVHVEEGCVTLTIHMPN
jgi:histidine phosphotransferase ChpT